MNRWLRTNTHSFNLDEKTLIMGILNATPDSFSDGGKYNDIEKAVHQAEVMEKQGADIIDIGGESTRPGHQPVETDEEINRVIPVIEAVSKAVSIPLSIDTYRAKTAEKAIEAGVSIINDVWGAKKDPDMARIAASYHVPIVLMHNRENKNYQNLIEEMKADLQESIEIALRHGVKEENIVLDPGVGFAKTSDDNLVVMRNLSAFTEWGYPLLLGTSRKSMIGKVLDLPAEERDVGTGATISYGITQGTDIVRVHNVEMAYQVTRMMDAMVGKGDVKLG